MTDPDRERIVVEETPPRVERETTVISTGERGSGGTVAAVLVLLVLAVLAFLYFGGYLGQAADETNINVNVDAPEVDLPDVDIPAPSQPANSS